MSTCLRVTEKLHIHIHWRPKAKRLGFVRATTPRVNDWGYLGRRISVWWSSVPRCQHWFMGIS